MPQLEHDPAPLQRVAHQLGLGQRSRESLFAVDVLACLHGVEHHLAMPVVGRGDHHGVDVHVGQQLAIVDVGLHRRVLASLDALLPVRSIDVADRCDLDVWRVEDGVDQVAAAGSQPDATHADCLAGRHGREHGRGKCRDGRKRCGGLARGIEKPSTAQGVTALHGVEPFWCHFQGVIRKPVITLLPPVVWR